MSWDQKSNKIWCIELLYLPLANQNVSGLFILCRQLANVIKFKVAEPAHKSGEVVIKIGIYSWVILKSADTLKVSLLLFLLYLWFVDHNGDHLWETKIQIIGNLIHCWWKTYCVSDCVLLWIVNKVLIAVCLRRHGIQYKLWIVATKQPRPDQTTNFPNISKGYCIGIYFSLLTCCITLTANGCAIVHI